MPQEKSLREQKHIRQCAKLCSAVYFLRNEQMTWTQSSEKKMRLQPWNAWQGGSTELQGESKEDSLRGERTG